MYTEYFTAERRAAPQESISRQSAPARRAAPKHRGPRRDTRRIVLAAMALVLFLTGFVSGCCVGRSHRGGDYVQEDLLPLNEYSRCGDKLERVNAVVIHYVGNPNTTAWQNRSYFENLATTGETSASSNLIVGMEGETLLCVPLDEVAYCSNERNHDTVSVEFCHPDADGKPTQATYDALVRLTAWLCTLYGLDAQEDVIRHYDVIGKQCPLYFVENAAAWTQFKSAKEHSACKIKKERHAVSLLYQSSYSGPLP